MVPVSKCHLKLKLYNASGINNTESSINIVKYALTNYFDRITDISFSSFSILEDSKYFRRKKTTKLYVMSC